MGERTCLVKLSNSLAVYLVVVFGFEMKMILESFVVETYSKVRYNYMERTKAQFAEVCGLNCPRCQWIEKFKETNSRNPTWTEYSERWID